MLTPKRIAELRALWAGRPNKRWGNPTKGFTEVAFREVEELLDEVERLQGVWPPIVKCPTCLDGHISTNDPPEYELCPDCGGYEVTWSQEAWDEMEKARQDRARSAGSPPAIPPDDIGDGSVVPGSPPAGEPLAGQ